jgi:hypothetical protein
LTSALGFLGLHSPPIPAESPGRQELRHPSCHARFPKLFQSLTASTKGIYRREEATSQVFPQPQMFNKDYFCQFSCLSCFHHSFCYPILIVLSRVRAYQTLATLSMLPVVNFAKWHLTAQTSRKAQFLNHLPSILPLSNPVLFQILTSLPHLKLRRQPIKLDLKPHQHQMPQAAWHCLLIPSHGQTHRSISAKAGLEAKGINNDWGSHMLVVPGKPVFVQGRPHRDRWSVPTWPHDQKHEDPSV